MSSYKLKSVRLSHREMKLMIGQELYAIMGDIVIPCLITGIEIGEDNKWKFTFLNEQFFQQDEPLYFTKEIAQKHARHIKEKRLK